MASILLPVAHVQQDKHGECLAACAAMILNYIGVPTGYRRLLKLLDIVPELGTPSFKLRNLERLNVTVDYGQGTLNLLYQQLLKGQPSIAFVQTGELPHWSYNTDHAVVVVGMDDEYIHLNDPEFDLAPLLTPIGDFDLAWLARDELYAVLTLPLR
jgi:ABC-type bacteriocin/lantibiotic exporter with double-glycine peptidase domain